jgi:hypothetical protein
MIQERLFQYGGLQVRLFKSDRYGWVTTTPELAKAVGYTPHQLRRIIEGRQLIQKESVIEDFELGKFFYLTSKGGPKPKAFWTIEGMTFIAMYLSSPTCDQFRNEVLKTIKSLEQQGFVRAEDVALKFASLEKMVFQLTTTVESLEERLRIYDEVHTQEMSFAGSRLSSARKWKGLQLVN